MLPTARVETNLNRAKKSRRPPWAPQGSRCKVKKRNPWVKKQIPWVDKSTSRPSTGKEMQIQTSPDEEIHAPSPYKYKHEYPYKNKNKYKKKHKYKH